MVEDIVEVPSVAVLFREMDILEDNVLIDNMVVTVVPSLRLVARVVVLFRIKGNPVVVGSI